MKKPMRIGMMATVIAVGALTFGAVPAFAGPGFHSTSASISNSGALVASWDERGLGNGDVTYTLAANASATYACINGGGNHPKATNKETVNGPVSASGTFSSDKNGRIIGSLTAAAPGAGSFSCPGGQRLVLAAVSYSSIQLTDGTNGASADLASVSRTFIAL